jgi:hypothetical protein
MSDDEKSRHIDEPSSKLPVGQPLPYETAADLRRDRVRTPGVSKAAADAQLPYILALYGEDLSDADDEIGPYPPSTHDRADGREQS